MLSHKWFKLIVYKLMLHIEIRASFVKPRNQNELIREILKIAQDSY